MSYYAPEAVAQIARDLANKYKLSSDEADKFVYNMQDSHPNIYLGKEAFLENELLITYNRVRIVS